MRRIALVLLLMCASLAAQEVTFRGRVDVIHRSKHKSGSSEVVVWLTPAQPQATTPPAPLARLIRRSSFPTRTLFFTMSFPSIVASRLIWGFTKAGRRGRCGSRRGECRISSAIFIRR
jgi:hypothetical protein